MANFEKLEAIANGMLKSGEKIEARVAGSYSNESAPGNREIVKAFCAATNRRVLIVIKEPLLRIREDSFTYAEINSVAITSLDDRVTLFVSDEVITMYDLEQSLEPGKFVGYINDKKRKRPIKILFLAANPKNTERLRLDEEIRGIDQALRQAEYHERFDIAQQWAVRVSDLQDHFLRYKPDIVHFSGYGSDTQEIILEDQHGESQPAPVRALSKTFSLLKDNIRCVVLNACYSEPQAKAIAEYIDCVIGMSENITDKAAIKFSAAFYKALGYGRDVKTAFELGCNQIDLEKLEKQDIPKLLALKNKPEEIVFVR